MAIFGRMTARQRLRRATRESLATPAFSSPIDCTPWVTGGLWPAELSTITGENATIAEYLKADLQRIADGANEQLKMLKRAGLADLPRQAEEARVIDEARDRAVRRIESTIRHLHTAKAGVTAGYPRPRIAGRGSPDMDQTQVIPAVTEAEPPSHTPARSVRKPRWRVVDMPAPVVPRGGGDETEALPDETAGEENAAAAAPAPDMEETQVIPRITEVVSVVDAAAASARPGWESVANGRHHAEPEDPATYRDESQSARGTDTEDDAVAASMEETQIIPTITEAEPVIDEPAEIVAEAGEEPADSGRHHAVVGEPVAEQDEPEAPREPAAPTPETTTPATDFDVDRLNRLLEFAVRQEPRLNWAVGDLLDGTTVLVTDLAHGWIPAGINLPAGVRLLEPERRTGRVSALISDAARVVTYAPGDSLRRSADFAATKSSVEPRELPAIEDLGKVLSETTRRFDGLPRIVQRLADAAAAEAVVIDQEVDVLRVHLDTARYQLLVQYPTVNPALVLKCLLMAATESIASGDRVSANYHLAWYQKLAIQPAGA